MESRETNLKPILLIGAMLGAVLGAGVAYLLSTSPSDEELDDPITAKELLGLTSVAALFARRIDTLRRRI